MMRKWGFAALLAAPVLALAACDDGSESAVFATPPNPPAPPPPPPPPPAPSTFSITGQLSGNEALATDSDVNDQFSAVVRNNSFSTAQTEQTPAIIKGFVTLPGTGVPQDNFPNAANNDVSDFFAVTASAGQIVNLQIADFEPASPLDVDLDLALYDASQNLIASSNSLGASESIQIAADGDYFIEVVAFRGTSIYTLTISTALASSSNGIAPHIGRVSPIFLSVEADPSDAGMQVLQAASVMSASSQPTKQLKRGDVVRLDPKALVASAQLQSDGQIDTSSEKRRLRAAQIEALRVAKAMNVAEGRDVYKLMEQPRTFQSDPNPDPFLQWNLPSIGWPEAQTLIADAEAASGPFTYDPIVAVIDSGFQTAHPDIAPVLGDQREFVPASVDGDGFQAEAEEDVNPADPGFCHSFHGSHVGSTATAPQNSVGIVGVFPGVELMGVKIGYSIEPFCEFLPGDLPNAILYAAGLPNASGATPPRRADVINMSLGSSTPSTAVNNAIQQAVSVGVIVVAAAGNAGGTPQGTLPSFPAAFANVVAVASTDIQQQQAFYSQSYPEVDIAAPGGDVTVDLNFDGSGDGVLAAVGVNTGTSFRSGLGILQGTSMASPHVAGAIGLMKRIAPTMTPAQFDSLLQSGALTNDIGDFGRDNQTGWGLMSLPKMVQAAIDLNAGGAPAPVGPSLLLNPSRVDFGQVLTSVSVTASQIGSGSLSVVGVTGTGTTSSGGEPWLLVNATNVDGSGFGVYQFVADRSVLEQGTFEGEIVFDLSDGSSTSAPVTVSNQALSPVSAESSPIFFVLDRQEASGEFVEVTQFAAFGGLGEVVTEGDLEPGTYRLVFGTDIDNDFFICDAGELCGSFPTAQVNFEAEFELNSDLTGLNFAVTDFSDTVLTSLAGETRMSIEARRRDVAGVVEKTAQ